MTESQYRMKAAEAMSLFDKQFYGTISTEELGRLEHLEEVLFEYHIQRFRKKPIRSKDLEPDYECEF